MDPRLKTELQHLDGVDVRWGVPWTDRALWHAEGPATCLIRPLHVAGLQRAVQVLNTHTPPFLVLGRGSNRLVSYAGVRARDNAALIQVAREKVLERLQVKLELEVHLPGTEFKV